MEKKSSKGKSIFIFIGLILVIFAIVIGYLVVGDLKQEDLLKKEIVNVSNKDLLTDSYDIEVKTTGDYAYIEEAVKKYYKKLSDNVKIINNYLNDEDLIYILSAENLQSDGPKFEKSYQILKETKEKSTLALQNIIDLCKEDTIKDLIDKEKVDDYSYDLYLELMYTEDDLEVFAKTQSEMQTISDNLNVFLNKVEEMIKMLENNSDYWYIEDGQLYFETDDLVNQYNRLYNELNVFVKEKFSEYADNNDIQNNI